MAAMINLLLTNFWWLLIIFLVFGPGPTICFRLMVRIYPAGDHRRDGLVAVYDSVPIRRRPLWVLDQLIAALDERRSQRLVRVRERRLERKRLQLLLKALEEPKDAKSSKRQRARPALRVRPLRLRNRSGGGGKR